MVTKSRQTVAEIVRRIEAGDTALLDELPIEELTVIVQALEEAGVGEHAVIDYLWNIDYEDRPVSIDGFLEDEFYLGGIGTAIYPEWRDELRYVLDPANEIGEWLITGAVGTGKTTCAVIAQMYKMYCLICLKAPAVFYGLAPGSPFVFGLFNIFKFLAKDVSYTVMLEYFKLSPYFTQYLYKTPRTQQIDLPKSLTVALGANAIHALGQNCFGGILDEANFGKEHSPSSLEHGQVYDLYTATRDRMDSRFLSAETGRNPGLLCLVSSPRDQSDFLEGHLEKKRGDKHTHITKFSRWDVKPGFKTGGTFQVVIGDKHSSSRIAEDDDELPPSAKVIDVPNSLYERFKFDLDTAIRDIAGEATYGYSLLLPHRDRLFRCYDQSTPRVHPFNSTEVTLSIYDNATLVDQLDISKIALMSDKTRKTYRPRFYPRMPRFIHVDLAKSGDAAGLAMGGLSELTNLERFDDEGFAYKTQDFKLFIDIMLRIRAAPNSEIDFEKIREFVFYLRNKLGFPVERITYDSWQSVDSIQLFKKARFDAGEYSLDRSPTGYFALKTIINELRLDAYEYEPFTNEITTIRVIASKGRSGKEAVDHVEGGSKDCSDGVAGVAGNALLAQYSEYQTAEPPGAEDRTDAMKRRAHEEKLRHGGRDASWISNDYVGGSAFEPMFDTDRPTRKE